MSTGETAKKARRLAERQADAMPEVDPVAGPKRARVVDADLKDPAPRGGLIEVFQQGYLLRLIVSRQLAQQYSASLLGLAWSYIQPGLRFAVYYIVMGLILHMHDGVPYFAIHLFTGMVIVHYFGETWSGGTRAIWSNKGLVKKNRIPREIFPVSMMLVAAYHTLPQVIVLVFFCLLSGWHLTWSAIAAGAIGIVIIVSFATALALIFSALNVFFRDFQNIVHTIMQFMHFLVPMMYPFTRIWQAHASHPWIYNIYMANPVAQAVLLLQRFFWYPLLNASDRARAGQSFPPDQWVRGLITLAASLLLLWLAQKFFTRAEARFPERL